MVIASAGVEKHWSLIAVSLKFLSGMFHIRLMLIRRPVYSQGVSTNEFSHHLTPPAKIIHLTARLYPVFHVILVRQY